MKLNVHETWILMWVVLSAFIIYLDINKHSNKDPLSSCHNAEVKTYKDKYLCTECQKWCTAL